MTSSKNLTKRRRFWIFESFTLLYAIGLMTLGIVVWGKTTTIDLSLFVICLCLASGLITWFVADGKHWFIFGLIYEVIFLFLIIIGTWVTGSSAFNDLCQDMAIFFVFIFTIAIVSFLPTLALAFLGYHLFCRNIGNKKCSRYK